MSSNKCPYKESEKSSGVQYSLCADQLIAFLLRVSVNSINWTALFEVIWGMSRVKSSVQYILPHDLMAQLAVNVPSEHSELTS